MEEKAGGEKVRIGMVVRIPNLVKAKATGLILGAMDRLSAVIQSSCSKH